MEEFYGWIRSIVCYVCLFHIFLQILPSGDFKKYVRFFGGLLLVLIVMAPIADLGRLTDRLELGWQMESLREQEDQIRMMSQGMEELRSGMIDDACRAEMKKQIEEMVYSCGMLPDQVRVEFEEQKNSDLPVPVIRKVELKVSVPQKVAEEESASADGQAESAWIKKRLEDVYHISSEHINISIQE
ncbi:MAG: stage III sporulation protein AF [Blautia sp.]|nr:stage III sporulation protein AF [Blautia sp.]MDY4516403.1 stage III sporulation protein AF [Lachnospiraceae bacterium]